LQNSIPFDISPAGSELLVGSFSQNYYQSLLWIVPLPAGSPRRLADITGQDGTWFPDGTRILYAYLPCLSDLC